MWSTTEMEVLIHATWDTNQQQLPHPSSYKWTCTTGTDWKSEIQRCWHMGVVDMVIAEIPYPLYNWSATFTKVTIIKTTQLRNSIPYQCSILDPAKRKMFEELERKYSKSRTVSLWCEIHGLSFKLDTTRCPVGSDELVKRVHAAGHYYHKPLHISLWCTCLFFDVKSYIMSCCLGIVLNAALNSWGLLPRVRLG